MRIAQTAFTGIVVALAVLARPALAKTPTTQKADEPTTSTCSAYQQAPDGSWTQLPCKENSERNPAASQRNSAAPSTTRTR